MQNQYPIIRYPEPVQYALKQQPSQEENHKKISKPSPPKRFYPVWIIFITILGSLLFQSVQAAIATAIIVSALQFLTYNPRKNRYKNSRDCHEQQTEELAKSSPASEILLQSTPPDQGSKHTSGASEPFFKYYLENYFPNLITQNVNMLNPKNSPGYEYEPDFAFIDSNSGIHIDIEIDEPYKLKGYNPTHFIGQDNKRDDFFLSRNWIVVRFAEEQVCRWPKECCKEIALIVDEITGTYYLNLFENVDRLPSVPQWTEEDAIDLANKRDRDRYLPSP